MKISKRLVESVSVISAVLVMASGCSSAPEDVLQGGASGFASATGGAAIVEAFVEYAGPAERWGGPEPLMVQWSARDSTQAYSLVSMPDWKAAQPEVKGGEARKPASAQGDDIAHAVVEGEGTIRKSWNSPALRAQLATLAEAVSDPHSKFQGGCLYPVRVRLLRADGSVLEKAGCRSSKGWTRVAGALVAGAF